MKKVIKFAVLSCFLNPVVYAQVVTDGTTGAVSSLSGNNMQIPQNLGTTVGNNLFHSFSTFNINTGEKATFTGASTLQNVVSRVTGINNPSGLTASNIDGKLISAIPNANFYFINPVGITFGANASVNVPAAFHVSTADRINFVGGGFYSATDIANSSTFSAVPASFGFLDSNTIGTIAFNGSQITKLNPQQILDVVAGNINISAATLYAPAGEIRMVAIQGASEVSLDGSLPTQNPLPSNAGNITITAKSLIDTDNASAVSPKATDGINIWSNSLSVLDKTNIQLITNGLKDAANLNINTNILDIGQSQINTSTYNVGNAGNVTINAQKIIIDGTNRVPFVGIGSNAMPGSIGNAGNVTINTGRLELLGGAQIQTEASSNSKGNAGNVLINATSNVEINGSQINSTTSSSGHAGNISVTGNNLTLNGGFIGSGTASSGNAGNVEVNASNSLTLSNNTHISGSTAGSGRGGDLTIKAGSLSILSNSLLASTVRAGSSGDGGSITVKAGSIKIDNQAGGKFLMGIDTQAERGTTGNAGNISVEAAGAVEILNYGAAITSSTLSVGDAGSITVKGDNVTVSNRGSISSDTYWAGNAGSVYVTGNSLKVLNGGKVSTDTYGTGKGGDVSVAANNLIALSDKGEISSTARTGSKGAAGSVEVIAPLISLDDSSIAAKAEIRTAGQTGNVIVTATQALNLSNNAKITLQNEAHADNPAAIIPTTLIVTAPNITLTNSNITTEATDNIKASDIVINFTDKLMLDPSYILTTANTGDGGSIFINGGNLIYLKDSGFQTSVSGANSNGGNISTTANFLVMDTGVIQANAIGGSGGNVNLTLKGLIASYDQLILGGSSVHWLPFVPGFNVIQAASANGVSGNVNITSPQFNISGITKGLDAGSLTLPSVNRNPCQNSAGNSLKRSGKGGLPLDEEKDDFIPAVKMSITSTGVTLASSAANVSQTRSHQPCAATLL